MFRKLIGAAFFLIVGGGLTYYGLGQHFINTSKGRIIIPKKQLTATDTFVDITNWDAADFKEHPHLTQAMIDHGHGDLVMQTAGDTILDKVKDKVGEWLKDDAK